MGQLRIDVRQLQKGFNILLPYKIQFMNTGIQNVVQKFTPQEFGQLLNGIWIFKLSKYDLGKTDILYFLG